MRALAEDVQAPGGEIDSLCGVDCAKHPLADFFAALEILDTAKEPVRVAVFGNSLIAADGITGYLRERMVDRFGDGGRGLLLAERLGPWGPRARTGTAKGKWILSTVAHLEPLNFPHGVTGAQHQAGNASATTEYALNGETQAQLWWLPTDDENGLKLSVDGKPVASYRPTRAGVAQRADFELPVGARSMEISADGAGPVIQGVVLERKQKGGVIVDTLGVPSVDASLFLRTDEGLFVDQLAARAPSLVTLMLGGNEVKRLAWNKATPDEQDADLRTLIRRTRTAAPLASCLVVGPIDSVRGPSHKPAPFEQRAELEGYRAQQKRIAREEGCAYFDLFLAMGGSGSLKRFHARGMIHADLVHPRGKGLDLLGELLSSALLRAYDGRPAPTEVAGAH
ncbi:MAG: GDSL-type esterase/lipase family protein [Myxococcaceae bacterium]